MAITLTREQLYTRVWETPIDTLRKEFGLSNVGLGKLCRRHQIPVPPRGYGPRHRWRDGKKQRLEQMLNRVIEGLVQAALLEKERHAEREREQARRREIEQRRREALKKQRAEQARIDQFNELVAYWKKTQDRRAFLASLRDAVGPVDGESELGRWLAWADAYIEVSDPLDRFRNRSGSVRLYFSGYDREILEIRATGFRDPEP